MKVKNRLLNFGDNVIYQDNECLMLSLDSVLLANFVTVKLTDKKILDLCSGNAPVPMLLSFRTKAGIFGVELQKNIFDLGMESVCENKMDDQITLINDDVKNLSNVFLEEEFDIITCNPPFFKYQTDSLINDKDEKTIARHEVCVKLEDIIKISRYLLKNHGTLALVHRPERLIEIINLMQKYRIEPKKVRFVYPKEGKDCNTILIEGVKNGKSGLKVLGPLVVHDKDGYYTEEVRKMFGGVDYVAEKL